MTIFIANKYYSDKNVVNILQHCFIELASMACHTLIHTNPPRLAVDVLLAENMIPI